MKTLSAENLAALIELLTDRADPEILELLRQQLREMDDATLRRLRERCRPAPDYVAMEVDEALQQRVWCQLRERLGQLRDGSVKAELLDLMVLLAQFGHPDVDEATVRQQVARLHVLCDCRLSTTDAPLARATELADFLGREMAFHGNQDNYYDPNNVYLDSAIAARQGNPVTLTALYLILGGRLGIPLRGIFLKDYAVVGVYESRRDTDALLYLDPFRRGEILSRMDCVDLVEQQGATFAEEMLDPVDVDLLFRRMLDNLYDIYERAGSIVRCEALLQFMEVWDPGMAGQES